VLTIPLAKPDRGEHRNTADERPRSREVEKQLQRVQDCPEAYLHSLGVGDFKGLWRDVRGRNQVLCMMDFGADESLPVLQERGLRSTRPESRLAFFGVSCASGRVCRSMF